MGDEKVKAILLPILEKALPILEKALKELSKEYWEIQKEVDIMLQNDYYSSKPPTESEQKKFDELVEQANDYIDAISELKAIIEQVKNR